MVKKIIVLAGFIIAAVCIFIFSDSLVNWLQNVGSQSFALTASVATLLALFPIIPYPIIGGLIGAAFGPVLGSLITWIGSALASILMFILLRYAYQDFGQKVINRYRMTAKITLLFEQNAFMTIFITRLIPIVPSILVNAYAALSRVPASHYIVASSLGKIPSMILFATVGDAVLRNPINLLFIGVIYALFLLFVYAGFTRWRRRMNQT